MPAYELGKSKEDYLEAILVLQKNKGVCYSIDVANALSFSKPSVSNAVKKLESDGYITRDSSGVLYLTETGREIAEKTYEKHMILTTMFESLGVPSDIAEQDACKIEHNLHDVTFEALKKHFNISIK